MDTLLQLVARGIAEQMAGKIMYVSRVVEFKLDPETGKLNNVPCGHFDACEGLLLYESSKSLKFLPYYALAHHPSDRPTIQPLWRNTIQIQLINSLPLPIELCEYIRAYIGFASLGLCFPRCFTRTATWDHPLPAPPPQVFENGPRVSPSTSSLSISDILPLQEAKNTENMYYLPHFESKHVLFVKKSDVQQNPNSTFQYVVNGNPVNSAQGIWLLTNKKCYFGENWIILPFPSLRAMPHCCIQIISSAPLYYAHILPLVPTSSASRWFLHIANDPVVMKYPGTTYSWNLHCSLTTCVRLVFCYKNRPVKIRSNAVFTHPISSIRLSLNGLHQFAQDGEYYRSIVPWMYGEPIMPEYLVYHMIFHESPSDYVQTDPLAASPYLSTINFARLDDIRVMVTWDENVLREQFLDPTECSLHAYAEHINQLIHDDGFIVVRLGH